MSKAAQYRPTADFRQDPLLMKTLRAAIGTFAMVVPAFEDSVQEALLVKYRDAHGERTASTMYSAAKLQLDSDARTLRRTLASVLGTCLYSQLDRLQGREQFWPVLDSEEPQLVPDDVIARRMVIDDLLRGVNLDAEEGCTELDRLASIALGRYPSVVRDNPLRPAVFFHSLGLAWTRGGGQEELLLLSSFGAQMLPRVIAVYPAMCAVLREGLDMPRRNRPSGSLAPRAADGAAYSRMIREHTAPAGQPADARPAANGTEPSANSMPVVARGDDSEVVSAIQALVQNSLQSFVQAMPVPPPAAAASDAAVRARDTAVTGSRTAVASGTAETASGIDAAANSTGATAGGGAAPSTPVVASIASVAMASEADVTGQRASASITAAKAAAPSPTLVQLERVARLFQPWLSDDRLPVKVRLMISRLQIPSVLVTTHEPEFLDDTRHPLRELLTEVSNPSVWDHSARLGNDESLALQLGVIVEMINHVPLARGPQGDIQRHLLDQFRSMRGESKVIPLARSRSARATNS